MGKWLKMLMAGAVLALAFTTAPIVADHPTTVSVAEADTCRLPVTYSHGTVYGTCQGVTSKWVFQVHYDILWYNQDLHYVYKRVWNGGQYVWVFFESVLDLH